MYGSEEFIQFDVDCLRLIKTNDYIPLHKDIVMYKMFIEYTNNNIFDYLEYKRRYTSDFNFRTKDNENALNVKRIRLIEELKEIESDIRKARDYLKKYLLENKLIKKETDIKEKK